MRDRGKPTWLVAVLFLLMAQGAGAQEVGTVASMEGSAEIGRAGAWTAAAIGSAVSRGDEVRTGRPGRLRIVFQDDSVLTLDDDSHLTVDEQVFDPTQGQAHSLMGLLQGKVSALVGDYYHRAGAVYEIKTATATAGVRGTEFTMSYDAAGEVTEVVGVSGHVEVHSVADPEGPGVLITAREATSVTRGQLPTSPRRIEDTIFRQQLEGIDFIGAFQSGGVSAFRALSAGNNVPPPDRAGVTVATAGGAAGNAGDKRDASNLIGDSPAVVRSMTGQLGIDLGRR